MYAIHCKCKGRKRQREAKGRGVAIFKDYGPIQLSVILAANSPQRRRCKFTASRFSSQIHRRTHSPAVFTAARPPYL